MNAIEIMWLREYIRNRDAVSKNDTDALREKKHKNSMPSRLVRRIAH
jgi:hypothetical protein